MSLALLVHTVGVKNAEVLNKKEEYAACYILADILLQQNFRKNRNHQNQVRVMHYGQWKKLQRQFDIARAAGNDALEKCNACSLLLALEHICSQLTQT